MLKKQRLQNKYKVYLIKLTKHNFKKTLYKKKPLILSMAFFDLDGHETAISAIIIKKISLFCASIFYHIKHNLNHYGITRRI
jgi:hypothetical protein